MGDIFIISYLIALVIYDIALGIRKKKTITFYMRKWYAEILIVPYAVGVIFLGHFLDLFNSGLSSKINVLILTLSGAIMLCLSIALKKSKIKIKKRILILIPIALGYLAGDLFW